METQTIFKPGFITFGFYNNIPKLFSSPEEFFNIKKYHNKWFLPFLLALVFTSITVAFFNAKVPFEKKVNAVVEQSRRYGFETSEEELAQVLMAKGVIVETAETIGFVIIALAAIALLVSGLFFVVFQVAGGDIKFTKIFSIYQWAFLAPIVVGSVLQIFVIAILDKQRLPADFSQLLPTNLAALFNLTGHTIIQQIAASIDLFWIWAIVLLCIGFRVIIKKLSTKTIYTTVISSYVTYILVKSVFSEFFF